MSDTVSAVREIRPPLIHSTRCAPVFSRPRPSRLTPQQAAGLAYEKKVGNALSLLCKRLGPDAKLEKNPWFSFQDANGTGACSPDNLLIVERAGLVLVVEVKLSFLPTALTKLARLYVPIVNATLKPLIIRSVVICKNVIPGTPMPISGLGSTEMTASSAAVYQWLGQGPILW